MVIKNPALLISANPHKTDLSNRFSFFCANPTARKVFNSTHNLSQWQKELKVTAHDQNNINDIPFCSGWLGYFAYPEQPTTNRDKPIAEFNYYPWSICFDHKESTLHILGSPTNSAREIFSLLINESKLTKLEEISLRKNPSSPFITKGFNALWNKKDYELAFEKVQYYLKAGDCYQINLTQPYKASFQGTVSSLLNPLLTQMQPNFAGYFKGSDIEDSDGQIKVNSAVELISLSPERFMSISSSGKIEAKPIKGTIKRDTNNDQDQLLINELIHSSKNQAENLMIVDLLRNDINMSALPGTVKVDKLFELESHPNVHHLVSTISAQLKSGVTQATAIDQAFPGGSITGAPKIRAMEIIEELEAEPRSLYCGSLGYFSDSGHCDFNILIRNLEFQDGTVTCWGGGGITVDSEINDEYQESITKIQRIMDIVESAGKPSN